MDLVNNCVRQALTEFKPYEIHHRLKAKDGSIRVLHSLGEPLFNAEGKVFKLVGTAQDVTEKHNLIERLKYSEDLYKQAQAMSHIGNWTLDVDARVCHWTDELFRIYGLEPSNEPVPMDQFMEMVHPEDRELVERYAMDVISSGKTFDMYHRNLWKDGTVKVLHIKGQAELDNTGRTVRLFGTTQDVTEQSNIEEQLRENRNFIQKIADATPSIITSYNVNTGQYRFISKGLQTLLNYDPKQPMEEGVPFFMKIVHPDDLPVIMEKNAQAMELANSMDAITGNDLIVEFQYRMLHNDGNYRWFQTYGTIFDRNAEGKVEHVLNISMDITGRKEAEHELERKNIELEQSNASLEEFAYVASHDLQEPLRKISVFGQRLQTIQDELNSENQIYLKKIVDSSVRMQKLIDDLLIISRISHDKSFQLYSLDGILQEVIQLLEHKIEKENAIINAPSLPQVFIVPAQFRQLFLNLLSNSLKFIQEGQQPKIDISWKYLTQKEIAAYNIPQRRRYLQLTFSDNGIGFPNEYANKIFVIFQRLHGRSEYEGTGIGLAICKKIVENHAGIIFANSEEGKGTMFTVVIPN